MRSREIIPAPSLHRASTDALITLDIALSEVKYTHTNKTDEPQNSCNLTAQGLLEFVHRGMMLEDNDFL